MWTTLPELKEMNRINNKTTVRGYIPSWYLTNTTQPGRPSVGKHIVVSLSWHLVGYKRINDISMTRVFVLKQGSVRCYFLRSSS